jgi:DNA invertase Pin-like site-specific DNA recombinase
MIMQNDSKVTACHLTRNAYLYVRQSTVRQVFENTESTKRQYALRQKAIALGWPSERIEVIDTDLGQSGASSMDRQGFQKLVTEVGLGRAGIVMGLEVSRLARNSTDWHRLLEICAVTDTLILDEDGLYDPAHFNDRLLLGLKGTMSEAELHVMRARLRGGLLNKARRGELRCHLPIGLVYDSNNQVAIDPDKQVQGSLHLLFKTFSRIGTAHAVVKHFRQNSLLFPRRIHGGPDKGNLVWGPLGVRRVLLVLHNPRYAGAYAFGRGRWKRHPDGHKTRVLLPREEWQVFIRDSHSGYISWQDYERFQHQIRQSALAYGADRRHGPPREGPALLQGRVVCGICGNRMSVHYRQRSQELTPEYICNRRRMEDGSPTCQTISGASIDAAVGKLLVEAMTPMAVEVALAVQQEIQLRLDEADRLRYQQVERARYEADCARRRYMHVDPANRLVADSLEAEWNEKLRASTEAQDHYERQRNADRNVLDEAQREKLFGLTQDFPAIWNDAKTPQRERKRMVGLLIDDVTLIRGKQVTAHVRYRGGATRTLNVPLPLNAWQGRKTPQQVVDLIDELLEHHTDAQVVDLLNERGCVTGADDKFSIESLRWIRYSGGLKSYKKRLMEKGMITPKETVTRIGISYSTLDLWRNKSFLRSCKCNDKGDWLYYLPSDEDINKMKKRDRISSPEISRVRGLPENLQEV